MQKCAIFWVYVKTCTVIYVIIYFMFPKRKQEMQSCGVFERKQEMQSRKRQHTQKICKHSLLPQVSTDMYVYYKFLCVFCVTSAACYASPSTDLVINEVEFVDGTYEQLKFIELKWEITGRKRSSSTFLGFQNYQLCVVTSCPKDGDYEVTACCYICFCA